VYAFTANKVILSAIIRLNKTTKF